MSRSWVLNSRGIARKVKGGSLPSGKQIKDCGAKRECPKCHFLIDNSDVSHEWPGLPVGVKFDPTDIEILEHLAAKCGAGNSESHMFIDEFIPTIDAEGGICHKHPEELPGSRKDGSNVHFFHRTTNAYTTGHRKRRKIHNEPSSTKEIVRWHKTGKTKPVIQNGVQIGCKKIMVLYGASVKGSKPEKANWVMHQYHLGTDEDEKEGQYVVSKIFYQAEKADKYDKIIVIEDTDVGMASKKNYQAEKADKYDNISIIEDTDVGMIQKIPKTPKTPTINPPRPVTSELCDDVTDDCALHSPVQESELIKNTSHSLPSHMGNKDDMEHPSWLGGVDDRFLCDEIFNSAEYTNLSEFDSLELDTPPDFHLSDIQFGSQDSIFGW